MKKMIIAVGSLGGTVSMTKDPSKAGVTPKLTAQDLIHSLGDLPILNNIDIISDNICQVPSSHIQFENLLQCYDWAKTQIAQGASGIVLTQGTDTLEESAFLLDLIWDSDVPLILTGAMKSPEQPGADGPANLLAAIITASSENSRGRGVMVTMNNWLHEARWVEKRHTSDVNAFHSEVGPTGIVFENQSHFFQYPSKRLYFPKPTAMTNEVFLYQATLDNATHLLATIAENTQGIVISALGAGHVSKEVAEAISSISKRIPVIISSSTLAGSTAYNTYGYIGSEIDLQQRAAIMSGWLSPKKSRLLAMLLLSHKMDIKKSFEQYLHSLTH